MVLFLLIVCYFYLAFHHKCCVFLFQPDGLLYLGVPTGIDLLAWNAHRIYGPIRWPIMMAGWSHLSTFFNNETQRTPLNRFWKNYQHDHRNQPVVVLKNDVIGC